MAKKIYLTEAQFKDYLRHTLKEGVYGEGNFLSIEQIEQLLQRMIYDDFFVYIPGSKRPYNCQYLNEKGDIFEAVCGCTPWFTENGRIGVECKKYGKFEIENLIGGSTNEN